MCIDLTLFCLGTKAAIFKKFCGKNMKEEAKLLHYPLNFFS